MDYEIYIHIPFCKSKCSYCDFPSEAGKDNLMEAYTAALCREIIDRAPELREAGQVRSVYIGGGTPSVMPTPLMLQIVHTLRANLPIPYDTEFTVEMNPGTADVECMMALQTLGVNRVSFGAQSFKNELLKKIGRAHTAYDIRNAVKMARMALINNVNIDLMYGLPGQTLQDLKDSINEAIDVVSTHISIYGLTVEEGTPLAKAVEEGSIVLPDEDEVEAMYDYMVHRLSHVGFVRYEISNFARPGRESKHNLGYWQDVPYVGFGAAAHSYWKGWRTTNRRSMEEYIEAIAKGESPAEPEEEVTRERHMEEFCFLALRTAEGINKEKFRQTFGCEIGTVYETVLKDLQAKGWLLDEPERVRLTEQGMKLGNMAFAEFLL